MNAHTKIVSIAFIVLMAGCGTYSTIYTNYDRSVDFLQYQTFAWAPDSSSAEKSDFKNTAYDNDIVRNNAKNYISLCMTKRGFLVDIDSPDLVIQLALLNEKKEKLVTYHNNRYSGYYFYNPYYFPYYYPYYRYYTWYGWNYPFWDEHVTYTKTYVKGTITINMYDRKQKKLVWSGSAEGDIYDPSYIQYHVHPAVDRIMKSFPIKPGPRLKNKEELKARPGIARLYRLRPELKTASSK